ncbi:hypothetical protein [Novipirellula caenicola]|uniref:Uncharacterized protein n=1 Tax=Novipirellula caenicola TaxID=1536901 RepID=A0ABP9VR75_9BACT
MTVSSTRLKMAVRGCDQRHGMLLMELVVALLVSSIIVAGLHACLAISVRSIPDSDGSTASALRGTRIADQLATDLETAVHITERSATTIGFTVPDRDGDGWDERIRYAWTGTPGGPLTRQYNESTPITIAEDVDQFNLTPSFESVAETYPSVGIEDANESLLLDYSGTTGLDNHEISSDAWVSQHFAMTLPAGAYAWRPTRVLLVARKSSFTFFPRSIRARMLPATINLTPHGSSDEQDTVYVLLNSHEWYQATFDELDPLASGGAVCLVLDRSHSSSGVDLQSTTAAAGMLKSANGGTSWSYHSGKALVSRLYGKLTRSNGTLSINSKYLTSMGVTMRMKPNTPNLNWTIACLNHPELLSMRWETEFTQDPTTLDVNGDATGDWIVDDPDPFDVDSLVDGVWRTNGTQLNTTPDCDFDTPTVVDVKFQNTTVGGTGATIKLNAFRSGTMCAPVFASLAKQSDGSQTLTLATKSSNTNTRTLLKVPGLPNQPVFLHLILDPETSSVSLRVNEVHYGTYALSAFESTDTTRSVCLGSDASESEFSYVRVRVMEPSP